jgi:hypothetical protein
VLNAPAIVVNVPTLAVKLPLESRVTIVEAPLEAEAVVRALAKVPVEILEALIAVKAEPSAVIIPAANSPDVPRSTMVLAPLEEEAVVLALATVPDEMLEALIAVRATPLPDTLVKVPVVPVITLPAKDPFESLKTIVEAPKASIIMP